MPLIVLCGLPCSGKSTRAKQLATAIESHIALHNAAVASAPSTPLPATAAAAVAKKAPIQYKPKVVIVNEESEHIVRGQGYRDATEEKKVRAALMSAVERELTRETVVVLDSMNYIKGYRYQLHCISKAARTTHCVYHCMASEENVRKWNADRATKGEDAYPPDILESLLPRLEEPNQFNRWDFPLFNSAPDDPEPPLALIIPSIIPVHPNLLAGTAAATTTDASTPLDGRILTSSMAALDLTPNQSTKTRPVARAGYLEGLDSAVRAVGDAVMARVRDGQTGETVIEFEMPPPPLDAGAAATAGAQTAGKREKRQVVVHLPSRSVTVAEMGRHRMLYLSSLNRLESNLSREEVAEGFADYLSLNLKR
ncbi:kti12, chromatin associated [Phlyctochytrium bullatum]|nr:kti12, chromatin associated [Phlyctochytrium bullatum]